MRNGGALTDRLAPEDALLAAKGTLLRFQVMAGPRDRPFRPKRLVLLAQLRLLSLGMTVEAILLDPDQVFHPALPVLLGCGGRASCLLGLLFAEKHVQVLPRELRDPDYGPVEVGHHRALRELRDHVLVPMQLAVPSVEDRGHGRALGLHDGGDHLHEAPPAGGDLDGPRGPFGRDAGREQDAVVVTRDVEGRVGMAQGTPDHELAGEGDAQKELLGASFIPTRARPVELRLREVALRCPGHRPVQIASRRMHDLLEHVTAPRPWSTRQLSRTKSRVLAHETSMAS